MINGCIEHNLVLEELVNDAKQKKRTLHVTFIDAFRSVPQSLIMHSFRRNIFPLEIILYIHNFYSNLKAKVQTNTFKSDIFTFKTGVFQGDP